LNNVLVGDCFKVLPTLEAESVDLCVTSPPYWGLRDYGSDPSIWGGVFECQHEWGENIVKKQSGGTDKADVGNCQDDRIYFENTSNFCIKCGAWRGAFGLEPHPKMFIDHLVEFGRLVRQVLKPSGLFWLNLGDTYYGSNSGKGDGPNGKSYTSSLSMPEKNVKNTYRTNWLQPKQLLMISSRVACALQDDGWILRSDVIWHKPNHMPESVTDRFTKSYEHFFMFSKEQKYFFNLDTIREKPNSTLPSGNKERKLNHQPEGRNHNGRSIPWSPPSTKHDLAVGVNGENRTYVDLLHLMAYNENGKNPGDVWNIPTQPFPGSHFAVFPEALVKRIIKCSSPPDGVVLDPFAGSGTTLRVARQLGRKFLGIELNPEFAQMAEERIRGRNFRLDLVGVDQYLLASKEQVSK
jgi:DNA modification methylase